MSPEHLNQSTCDEDPDENYDLILLKGCGQITKWKFPADITRCPVSNCLRNFENRDALILHYKKRHARKSILCYACNAPMSVYNDKDFEDHYRRLHPDLEMPIGFNQKIKQEPLSEQENHTLEIASDINCDLIELRGCDQITYWRFPDNTTRCPVASCQEVFEVRSDAIEHFKGSHAQHSILCPICNKAIATYSIEGFQEHYFNYHPNDEIPYNFNLADSYDQMSHINGIGSIVNGSLSHTEEEQQQTDEDLITLRGFGQITFWRFPRKRTSCPVNSCQKTFDNRLNAIEHFKIEHSNQAILCTLCNHPVIARHWKGFVSHCNKIHPNETIPNDFGNDHTSTPMEEDNLDANDLIELSGGGVTTLWQFPSNTTNCPVSNCEMAFGTRSLAIDHFKNQHAEHSIYCPLCDKPLTVHQFFDLFKSHYNQMHPNHTTPYDLYAENESTSETFQSNVDKEQVDKENDEEVDDMITLEGLGQIVQWRFPNVNRCPVDSCKKAFDSRSKAIDHYKQNHTKDRILCTICDEPIKATVSDSRNALRHFQDLHSNKEIPDYLSKIIDEMDKEDDLITLSGCGQQTQWRFPPELTRCPVSNCKKKFGIRAHAIAHYRGLHAKYAVFCSICNGPVSAKDIRTFSQHYDKRHPDEEKPVHLKDSMNGFEEDESNDDYNDDDVSWDDDGDEDYDDDGNDDIDDVDDDDGDKYSDDDLITLQGCGITTKWKFPPKLTTCPVQRCKQTFRTRALAIVHYKQLHAKHAIHCSLCDKPISAHSFVQFKSHYNCWHPYQKIPYNSNDANESNTEQETNDGDAEEEEVEDVITLEGLGQIVQWQFPKNVTRCPVYNCRMAFKFRSAAIAHYKQNHAKNRIICPICSNNIGSHPSNIREHFRVTHCNMKVPTNLQNAIDRNSSTKQTDSDDDDVDDDLITLFGCGKIWHWNFPKKIKRCPIRNCSAKCNARLDAIAHYQKYHTKNAILCSTCNKPVSAQKKSNIVQHYAAHHPHVKPPLKEFEFFDLNHAAEKQQKSKETTDVKAHDEVDDLIMLSGAGQIGYWRFPLNLTECPNLRCHANFSSRAKAILHFREIHAKNYIHCSICDKPIYAHGSTKDFLKHCQRMHPNEEISLNSIDKNVSQKQSLQASNSGDSDNDSENELITLTGGNEITQWSFPKHIKNCPADNCGMQFGVRFDVIVHYKKRHTMNHFYCAKCDNVISTSHHKDLDEHYYKTHPSKKLPRNVRESSDTPKKQVLKQSKIESFFRSGQDTKGDDDLIILAGYGQTTQWKFPKDVSKCPYTRCDVESVNRQRLIAHYREEHANNCIFCSICEKPFMSKHSFDIQRHYQRIHPNETIPFVKKAKRSVPLIETDTVEESDDEIIDDLVTLEGCGQITQWQFPNALKQCPVPECHKRFDTRNKAIIHYKKRHAKHSIYCGICDTPFSAHSQEQFKKHYDNFHPDIDMSLNLDDDEDEPLEIQYANSSGYEDETEDDDNDLIELTGYGQITKWKWPSNLAQCPMKVCRKQFPARSKAIDHFKLHHAMNTICCPICEKLVSVGDPSNLRQHYRRLHPNQKIPFVLRYNSKKDEQNDDKTSNNETSDEKSLITLKACGVVTIWQFPENTRECPAKGCQKQFDIRSQAIEHYQHTHANGSILCPLCNKPIRADGPYVVFNHYERFHPHAKMPYQFSDRRKKHPQKPIVIYKIQKSNANDKKVINKQRQQKDGLKFSGSGEHSKMKISLKIARKTVQCYRKRSICKVCGKGFMNISRHLKEMHSSKRICCPLMDCNFTTKRTELLRSHWNKTHVGIRFPEFRPKSGFSFEVNDSSDDNCDITKPSNSNASSDAASSRSSKSEKKRRFSDIQDDSSESLLEPMATKNDEDESSDFSMKAKKPKIGPRKMGNKRRISSSSTTSKDSSSDETISSAAKRRKLMGKNSSGHRSNDDSDESSSNEETASGHSTRIFGGEISANSLPKCSVVLERTFAIESLNLNETQEPFEKTELEPEQERTKNMPCSDEVIDLDLEFIDMVDFQYEQFENDQIARQSMEHSANYSGQYQSETLTTPKRRASVMDIGHEYNATVEDVNEQASSLDQHRAIYSLNGSNQEATERQISHESLSKSTIKSEMGQNVSHVQTMGVLMMATPKTD